MEIENILQGFKNLIFKNDEVEPEAERRLELCFNCPVRTEKRCDKNKLGPAVKDFIYRGEQRLEGKEYRGCNCFIELKTRSSSKCPLGKF